MERMTQEKDEKEKDTVAIVLDVTAIEPKYKHSTIFKLLEELEGGKSLIIENDHDPKPLHYQLMAEKGEAFGWEYLENGPVKWVVKITKKKLNDVSSDNNLFLKSVGEIASENPEKIEIFKKYGIDFCCGGNKTLKDACEESGIDGRLITEELNAVREDNPEKGKNYVSNQRANDWDIDFLIDYIVNIHHTFLRIHLPEAAEYMEKIAKVHGEHHPEIVKIRELFTKMAEALIFHLDKEEKELFQHIKNLKNLKIGEIQKEIDVAEFDHEYIGHILKEMDFLSSRYSVPEDACASYRHTYKLLNDIADDIMIHIHLENNILFKKI